MIISAERAIDIVENDRELTEDVLARYKKNIKLNDGELKILQAEVQKILRETPPDEELPNLYGHRFNPIDYEVSNLITTRLLLQGERTDRPFIINESILVNDSLREARIKAGYKSRVYGAREFENVDMRDSFLETHELNEYFDCYFLKTSNGSPYKAWFHKDYNGIIRYYSKSPFQHEVGWAFDAIDLYGMLIGQTDVLDHDRQEYLRHVSYSLVREQQDINYSPYVNNEIERLRNIKKELNDMKEASTTVDLDQTMYAVLETLLDEALARTFEFGRYDEFDRTMFFMSVDELSMRVENRYKEENIKSSTSTVSNAVNLLAALGFIKKLSDEDLFRGINGNELGRTRKNYAKRGWNQINYFLIRDVPSVYWINKQMNKLNKKRVTINNLTRKKLIRSIGKEMADKIYVLEDLSVKRPEYYYERKEYARLFLMEVKNKGFVTKEELSNVLPSRNVENKMWTELTNSMPGHSVRRTTKTLRKDLDVTTIGGVFVSYALVHPNEPITLGIGNVNLVREEMLLKVYEELTDEVLFWYGDVFKEYQRKRKRKRDSELFAEFLRTGIAPAELLA